MKDKVLHFIGGLIIVNGLLIAGLGLIWCLAILLAVSTGKELYDKYVKKTKFDILDMVAALIGGLLIPVSVAVLFKLIFQNI